MRDDRGPQTTAPARPHAFTVMIRGLPVSCETLDDLDVLLDRYGEPRPSEGSNHPAPAADGRG